MRYHQLVVEAPLADFDAVGDLGREGSFRPEDLRAIQNPKWREKVFRAFEKTPFDFNIYLFNAPDGIAPVGRGEGFDSDPIKVNDLANLGKYVGVQRLGVITNIIGKTPPNASDSITVLMVENEGAQRLPLTPWILAHRVGHAILESDQRGGGTQEITKHVRGLYDAFSSFSNGVKYKLKNSPRFKDRFHDNDRDENYMQVEYRHFDEMAKIIGTFRSARTGQLTTSGEFVVEMLAQYLIKGQVTFNRTELDDRGRLAPLDPKLDMNLFKLAQQTGRRDDFVLAVLKKEFWKRGSGFPRQPHAHYVAYDSDGSAVASSTEDRSDRWQPLGYTTKLIPPKKADIRKFQAMQDRQKQLDALYNQWASEGLFQRQLTATDNLDHTLTHYETQFNTAISDLFKVCIGKALVL